MQSCNICQDTFAQGWRNGEEKIIELTNVETDDEGKVSCLLMLVVCLNAGLFYKLIVCCSGKFVLLDCRQPAVHPPLSDQLSRLPGESHLGSKITFF